jgi:Signal transduction histidine kinase
MNTEEINVLYVDDEINNLNSFKATYRKTYQVYTALSAEEALHILDETDIHVIISDQRMPEVTGVELFKLVEEKYPEPVRVLLTAYTDADVLINAINQGHIYRYLTKPWNEIELNNCILNAYDKYQNNRELKEKIEELKKANGDLSRFIYSLSHELKAPLASAIGVIHLAKLDNLFEAQGGEYWGLLEECCKRLEYNISSSIDYYKNNHFTGIIKPIYFKSLVDTLISVHKRANNIAEEVNFNTSVNQGVDFNGDIYRIEIILGNLISNAIKYQRVDELNKTVSISVEVSSNEAVAAISDNGIGISQEDIAKIFKQFYRGKSKSQGSGLGLYIVKEALEKIGATISVQSTVNNGTTFVVKIPNISYKKEKEADHFSI